MSKYDKYDDKVHPAEWSRRQWVTSYIEKQENTIIPSDFDRFENFCKTGLMIEGEDFEDYVKFRELKAYLQEEAKCEQDIDNYIAFDIENPMHKHIDKAINFIKGLQKLDERIKYQEMFVLDFWSQISDKEKYETFLKTFDEKTLSIANEIIDKKNELRELEREKQDVLREIQYVKTELKRKENQLKKLNEKI